jgi:hypothetical protein
VLYMLADLADPVDYSTHVNQLILAKQLIEHGANVNAVSIQHRRTPLHNACSSYVVTNLDFVEYLLEVGADPNAQDFRGLTPLRYTIAKAPGAAKFLLNWPTTDANITGRSGESFQSAVRRTLEQFFDKVALPDNPETVQHQFQLQQWRAIEEMLVLVKGEALIPAPQPLSRALRRKLQVKNISSQQDRLRLPYESRPKYITSPPPNPPAPP